MKDLKTVTKWVNKLKYVNFKEEDTRKVRKNEFKSIIEDISKSYLQIKHTTKKSLFKVGCFTYARKDNYLILCYRDKKGFHKRYTNYRDDAKNEVREHGTRTLKDDFRKRVGITMTKAFGKTPQYFKRCVPGLFQWDNPMYQSNNIVTVRHAGKLDISSCYPSCACGKLPDATQTKTVGGIVNPNAEYPFAFYINSGFVAEYDGTVVKNSYMIYKQFSKIWNNNERLYPVFPEKYNEQETTVLMKASPYTLEPEMIEYYNIKQKYDKDSKEREIAKLLLLKVIGQMEQNGKTAYENNPFAHIAAVIKTRALFKMLDLMYEVGLENTIQVIVDGLLFDNVNKKHYGDKEEFLGSVKEEVFEGYCQIRGHGCYLITDNDSGEILQKRHQGFDLNLDDQISKWRKSPIVSLFKWIKECLGLVAEEL